VSPTTTTLVALLVTAIGLGMARPLFLPESKQYRSPFRVLGAAVRETIFPSQPGHDRVVNIAIGLCFVCLLVVLVGTIAAPPSSESFTDFAVVTENESGEFVASNYPKTLDAGTSETLYLQVRNREGKTTSYRVVAELQRLEHTDNGTATISRRESLYEKSITVEAGNTRTLFHSPDPRMTGSDLRLVYNLYLAEDGDSIADQAPYRQVLLWVNVTADDAATAERR